MMPRRGATAWAAPPLMPLRGSGHLAAGAQRVGRPPPAPAAAAAALLRMTAGAGDDAGAAAPPPLPPRLWAHPPPCAHKSVPQPAILARAVFAPADPPHKLDILGADWRTLRHVGGVARLRLPSGVAPKEEPQRDQCKGNLLVGAQRVGVVEGEVDARVFSVGRRCQRCRLALGTLL